MDSDFNDIGFLMENVKQEPTHERAGSLAEEDVESTDTIPTYMTDFILDYINRSLKVKLMFHREDTGVLKNKISFEKLFKMSVQLL